jgi:hypothetical protein
VNGPYTSVVLQGGHTGGPLEHPAKVEGTQADDLRQHLNTNILGEILAYVVLDLAQRSER